MAKRQKTTDKIVELLEARHVERQEIISTINMQIRDDDIDLFFKSIALSVKKLSPSLINEAKMRSLQMLFDLEHQNANLFNAPQVPISSPNTDYTTLSSSPKVEVCNMGNNEGDSINFY